MKKILFLSLFLLIYSGVYADNHEISDAGGNWDAVGTWVSGIVPATTDTVTAQADGTSGNLTVNVNSTISTFVLTNYIGQLSITTGVTFTITTTCTLVAGMTIDATNTGTLKISNTGTITSGGKTIPGNLFLDVGTFTLGDNWVITGSLIVGAGTNTINGNTMTIGGGIDYDASTSTLIAGTTNLVMNGTGTISGNAAYSTSYISNNLTFNTGGTITIGAAMGYRGTLTYTAGTIDTTTNDSILGINATTTLSTNGISWDNISFGSATFTVTLSNNLDVNGNYAQVGVLTLNGNTMTIGGDFAVNDSLSGTTAIVLDGTGTWSSSATTYSVANSLTINTAGTITLGSNVGYQDGTLTYTAGTIDASTNSSTLNILDSCTLNTDGITWYNITIEVATLETITLGSNLTCTNNFTVITTDDQITTAGAFDISCANFKVIAGVTWNMKSSETLTVTNSINIHGDTDSITTITTIKAVTDSTAFFLNYSGTVANCIVAEGVVFTDVDASGSSQGIDNWYGGTLTRTTNITNRTSADIGGGTGGGASFFTMGN